MTWRLVKSVYPVILCGGSGTRLWPLSRTTLPKQFLSLISPRTMLQETVLLFADQPHLNPPILVCSASQRFLAAEQMMAIGIKPLIHLLEPIGRNTAPAVAIAAIAALEANQNAILVVMPADLLIEKATAFQELITKACDLAIKGDIVTFGIEPTFASTGYGYIRRGVPIERFDRTFRVSLFVNKPEVDVANRFLH